MNRVTTAMPATMTSPPMMMKKANSFLFSIIRITPRSAKEVVRAGGLLVSRRLTAIP